MTLVTLEYQTRATSHPVYRDISTDVALSDLFLPEHLRLGPHNWLEFKHAIETVLRMKGIPTAHLEYVRCPSFLLPPLAMVTDGKQSSEEDEKKVRERWAADDELCKALIVLNVRSEHVRLALCEHERATAAGLWAALMDHDLECQENAERRWRWLKVVYFLLLGMVLRLAYGYALLVSQLV